jgi:hypothetical protein
VSASPRPRHRRIGRRSCPRFGQLRVPGPASRRRTVVRGLAAVTLGAATASLIACGSSAGKGLIPVASSEPLQTDFQEVAQAAAAGNGSCQATEKALEKTQHDFEALPSNVDAGLHTRVREGIENLRTQALAQCAQPSTSSTASTAKTSTTQTVTANTTPTQPTTPATTSTPTETVTTPTTPAPPGGGTEPGDEAPNEGKGPGPGKGNGNGDGNGASGGVAPGQEGR